MITFNVAFFLACFNGITLMEFSEQDKATHCFNISICSGSELSCKASEPKFTEVDEDAT